MHQATPGLPEFDYVRPASWQEASQFLAEHAGEARPFLGGTDTFVRLRDGVWKDKYLVDLKHLAGVKDISFDPNTGLTIGAAVNMNQVAANWAVREHYALLAQACNSVASYQLRTRATIVGNICNASPAGDTIGACIVLQGVLKVHGVDGVREEPLSGFFLGPGRSKLEAGDLVGSIRFPLPPEGSWGEYIKLGRNASSDLAIVGVTAFGYPDPTASSGFRFRLALASVSPTPLIPQQAEKILADKAISQEIILKAALAAQESATPISDPRGSDRYRRLMIRNLTKQAVEKVWQELRRI